MSTCNSCTNRAPADPVYNKSKPVINEQCVECGVSINSGFYSPPTGGKEVEVVAGSEIAVDDQSTSSKYKFIVSSSPHIALSVALTLQAYISAVLQSGLILKGSTIDQVVLTWSYNKAIASQNLTNNGGLTPPTLIETDVTKDYSGESITDDITFTISGDDELAFPDSVANDNASLQFGNYRFWGDGVNMSGASQATLEALLATLTNEISNSRAKSVNATGGSGEHFYYAYPKVLGLATFTKGIFSGGFVRLKLVGGVFKITLTGGDTESDFMYDNGNGFSEAYYVYMSTFDNQNDLNEPIVIS